MATLAGRALRGRPVSLLMALVGHSGLEAGESLVEVCSKPLVVGLRLLQVAVLGLDRAKSGFEPLNARMLFKDVESQLFHG